MCARPPQPFQPRSRLLSSRAHALPKLAAFEFAAPLLGTGDVGTGNISSTSPRQRHSQLAPLDDVETCRELNYHSIARHLVQPVRVGVGGKEGRRVCFGRRECGGECVSISLGRWRTLKSRPPLFPHRQGENTQTPTPPSMKMDSRRSEFRPFVVVVWLRELSISQTWTSSLLQVSSSFTTQKDQHRFLLFSLRLPCKWRTQCPRNQ